MQKKISKIVGVIFFIIITLSIFNYSLFHSLDLSNFKKITSIFSLNNNFYEYKYKKSDLKKEKNKINNLKLKDKTVFTITIFDKDINNTNIDVYTKNHHLLESYNSEKCIIKSKNKCTYIVDYFNINNIIIKNNSTKKITINSKSDIAKIKKEIIMKLFLSIIFVIAIIRITKYLNKMKIDKKILKKFKNTSINKIFIICASVIGITFSILYPLYQIPDELTHINMIYSERNLNINFINVNQNYGATEDIATHPEKTINYNKYFDLSKKIDYGFKFKIPSITI